MNQSKSINRINGFNASSSKRAYMHAATDEGYKREERKEREREAHLASFAQLALRDLEGHHLGRPPSHFIVETHLIVAWPLRDELDLVPALALEEHAAKHFVAAHVKHVNENVKQTALDH